MMINSSLTFTCHSATIDKDSPSLYQRIHLLSAKHTSICSHCTKAAKRKRGNLHSFNVGRWMISTNRIYTKQTNFRSIIWHMTPIPEMTHLIVTSCSILFLSSTEQAVCLVFLKITPCFATHWKINICFILGSPPFKITTQFTCNELWFPQQFAQQTATIQHGRVS